MEKKLSAVVFDMDGVLFDTERLCLIVWKKIAKKYGLENVEMVYHKTIGRTTPDTKRIVAETYPDIDVETVYGELRLAMHCTIAEDGLPVKPYAEDILKALKEKNVPVALASSTRQVTVEAQLEMAGFTQYFDAVIGGDSIGHSKPAPDIYLAACEKLGVSPETAAAVEDSFNGVRSAHSAGLYTVMVPDLLTPDDEMKSLADVIAADLDEVRELFLTML